VQEKQHNISIDERSQARKYVFEICYSLLIDKDTQTLQRYSSSQLYQEYIVKMYDTIVANFDQLTNLIQEAAEGYKIDRLYKVDLAILIVSVTEMIYFKNIPNEVSINEAVELAKIYSTSKSPKYINGVLSGVLKRLYDSTKQ